MKALKFSDAQKAFILKQGADGIPVVEICRRAGISQATYFNRKEKYDDLLPTEMKQLKQLDDENGKLQTLRRPGGSRGRACRIGRRSGGSLSACKRRPRCASGPCSERRRVRSAPTGSSARE